MILNNFWKAQNVGGSIYISSNYNTYTKDFGFLDVNGNSAPINIAAYRDNMASLVIPNIDLRKQNMGAIIGKGTGEIEATDYSLFDDCTSDFRNITVTFSVGDTDEGYSTIVTIRGINSTENDITITEAGVGKKFLCDTATGGYDDLVLFAKVLLDNPLTVHPNSSFVLTLEWVEA